MFDSKWRAARRLSQPQTLHPGQLIDGFVCMLHTHWRTLDDEAQSASSNSWRWLPRAKRFVSRWVGFAASVVELDARLSQSGEDFIPPLKVIDGTLPAVGVFSAARPSG